MKKASQQTQRTYVVLSPPPFSDMVIVHPGTRNLLREGGFNGGPVELDELRVGLVKKAVRKKQSI
jgi:hypothetical protein